MESVGHSRLLKFLVDENKMNKMEPPVFKLEYEYINPTNIESEVPGNQEIREGYDESAIQDSILDLDNKVENPNDYVLSPVITVTKQESEFTKGDLKLQKVSVTEDISEDKNDSVYKTNANPNIAADIPLVQPVRVPDDDKKTRIPIIKFKQIANAVRATEKKDEVPPPRLMQKRSSIPRFKDSRIPPPLDRRSSKSEIKVETFQPEDEFDKIYDEIIVNEPTEIAPEIIESISFEDPEKLENKFEEIIHDYEDTKVHPITEDIPIKVEKSRYSKIPLSRRKSEQDIKTPRPVERTSIKKPDQKIDRIEKRIPAPKDVPHRVVRSKSNVAKIDDKPNNVASNKIGRNIQETPEKSKAVDVKPQRLHFEPVNVANRETIEKKMKESIIKRENKPEVKNIEVIDRNHDSVTNITNIQPEIITEPIPQESISIVNDDIENPHTINDPVENNNEKDETNATVPKTEINTDYKDNEIASMDREYKPGKVSRLLQRIQSKEFTTDPEPKKEISIDVPRKKSVLSKIAMFERQDSEEEQKPRLPNSKPPILKPKEHFKEEVIDRRPIIVDEILKEVPKYSLPEERDDSLTKNYKIEIAEETVKYQEVQIMDPQETVRQVEDIIVLDPVINGQNILDKPTFEVDSIVGEGKTENIDEINPIRQSTLEPVNDKKNKITKSNSREFLEPPPQNIEEKVPREIVIEMLEHQPTEYEFQVQIISEDQPSDNIHNKDIFDYIPDINTKEEIPIDHITIHETKLETLEFKPIKNNDEFEDTDNVFTKESKLDQWIRLNENSDHKLNRPKSVAELDLGDAVKGKVHQMIVRMNSIEKNDINRKEINHRERPRKKSVSKIIALFEQKSVHSEPSTTHKPETSTKLSLPPAYISEEELDKRTAELVNGKVEFGRVENMTYMVLNNGVEMPVLAVGTALLEKRLVRPVIEAAIDMGYRAIDTAYIYGNELEVGEAIRAKIDDGTVTREDLFIISKLWNTFHRPDLVPKACLASLKAMGLQYFDLYLIHNPVSFKEGNDPVPKIANVVQYSSSDYMDAWYAMEGLLAQGLVKSIGVSNFNSHQIQRVLDKGRVKPVVNQVECHPYLTQERLDEFCSARDIKLSCFGVLGSKGTPKDLKSGLAPVIDDPLVKVMAAGLNISAAQLLIRYQIDSGHGVVVKASSAAHLWDNLQTLQVSLDPVQLKGLNSLNRNKRIFTFVGFGDTHRNYPFRIPF